jgi:formamidopyrimidine-DNA glycosylase
MPELPEVEVTRLSFADRIAGGEIMSVTMGKPLRWPLGCDPGILPGQRVLKVRRRGKYLLLDLSDGLLLIHLGMSGSMSFGFGLPEAGKHDHFDLVTSLGTLRLNDPRRFGAVVYARSESDAAAQKLLGRCGARLSNRCCWAAKRLSALATFMRLKSCFWRESGRPRGRPASASRALRCCTAPFSKF